ncbi:MAG TPA: dihydrolipoamide acetyltransferase family protein [Anaerolineae bacterium]
MATNIVMPALGMAQETGKLLQWLKAEGEHVEKGDLLMQIETDKVTVEIEAPASGTLANVTAAPGADIAVGQVIAILLAPGESAPPRPISSSQSITPAQSVAPQPKSNSRFPISPVAARIASENNVDLSLIKPRGSRIEKADVSAHLTSRPAAGSLSSAPVHPEAKEEYSGSGARVPASPMARRIASERGVDIATLHGSGPDGAVIAADVPASTPGRAHPAGEPLPTVWRVMAERMTQSWTTVPHFYLVRHLDVTRLVDLRARIASIVENRTGIKPTYTDLLVKLVATALRDHPRVNAAWIEGTIQLNDGINIGLASAIDDGLIVPVIHGADALSIGEIAARRKDLVERANAGKLRPADITGGTFTLTNLGMYNVDSFNAIINTPQAAILAVGRIADRVVPVDGQPAVRPMLTLTLACDHRIVDGARAAQFLDALANLVQEPWGLLA